MIACATPDELAQRITQAIPTREAPVVMTARTDRQIISHQTGLAVPDSADEDEFRAFHLSALPLPEELDVVFQNPN